MRSSDAIHSELRIGGEPPEPAEPVRRPRASHAFARARAKARRETEADDATEAGSEQESERPSSPLVPGHRRMYAQAEYVPTDVVVEQGGEMFRRTRVPRTRAALDDLGRRIATEATEMLDAELPLYPTPTPEHCSACDFRAPCLAMNEGADAEAVLAATYRVR